MTLQSLRNSGSLLIDPRSGFPAPSSNASTGVGAIIVDGAGESASAIGYILLENGAEGGSKTISAAGGKIIYASNTANLPVGSTLRLGIQDVDETTGLESGVFDVYGDYVGGVDILGSASVATKAMSVGSKTVQHGDLLAVTWKFTSFAASASIFLYAVSGLRLIPYLTKDEGAGVGKSSTLSVPMFTIQFDDGSLGWFVSGYPSIHAIVIIDANSSPDEMGVIFSLPVSCEINTVHVFANSIGATDTFDIVVYKDPLGSPVALQTTNYNPNYVGSSAAILSVRASITIPISPVKVAANRQYGIMVKGTAAGGINVPKYSLGVGNSFLRRTTILGENWGLGSRTDGGAFTYNTEEFMAMAFEISKIHDGITMDTF